MGEGRNSHVFCSIFIIQIIYAEFGSSGGYGFFMSKIYFNTRDVLLSIDLEQVAVVKAEGNYSRLYYINKHEILLTLGISRLQELLTNTHNKNVHFVRLGRSIIVNHAYLQKIDIQKQILELSKFGQNIVRVRIPKAILRGYKETIEKSIIIKQEKIHADNKSR